MTRPDCEVPTDASEELDFEKDLALDSFRFPSAVTCPRVPPSLAAPVLEFVFVFGVGAEPGRTDLAAARPPNCPVAQ